MIYDDFRELENEIKEIGAEMDAEVEKLNNVIQSYEKKIAKVRRQIKEMLPNGEWYSADIETDWRRPKKYKINKVEFSDGEIYVIVKEIPKRKPWTGYIGEHSINLKNFFELAIYETEQEALAVFHNRICSKCGNRMWESMEPWCKRCMEKRTFMRNQYNSTHRYYAPKEKSIYEVHYVDELTEMRERLGFYGKEFEFKIIDTGEVVRTNNLWSCGHYESNMDNLPEIEFLYEEEQNA